MGVKAAVKTKADLVRLIESLPDGWGVTTCMAWSVPETVLMCVDGSVQEIRRHLEIRIDGPTETRKLSY